MVTLKDIQYLVPKMASVDIIEDHVGNDWRRAIRGGGMGHSFEKPISIHINWR